MAMTDIVLHIAEMLRELDKKFGKLSWLDKQNNKEYDKALDRIRKEKEKHKLEKSDILSLAHKRSIVPLAWIKA